MLAATVGIFRRPFYGGFSVNRHDALFCVSAAFPFACSIKLQHIRPLGSFRWVCMS